MWDEVTLEVVTKVNGYRIWHYRLPIADVEIKRLWSESTIGHFPRDGSWGKSLHKAPELIIMIGNCRFGDSRLSAKSEGIAYQEKNVSEIVIQLMFCRWERVSSRHCDVQLSEGESLLYRVAQKECNDFDR